MILPDYWLPRPDSSGDPELRKALDRLWAQSLSKSENAWIDDTLPAPKWFFLTYLAERYHLALHGSGNPDIALFEPRQPVDLNAFGNQKAVFAAADGIWAMFFAIVDRNRYHMSVSNACIRVVDSQGRASEPYYLFSITREVLQHKPFRTGTVYLLPRTTFVLQPAISMGDVEIQIPQLASPVPVKPLARIIVAPDDFPFLNQIRGHDDARLQEYADAMQTGGPWPDDVPGEN